jgi:hypothetical protein
MDTQQIGSYAFIVGVVIAIIAGVGATGFLGTAAAWVPLLLVILGLIVGLLNITDKETEKFLISAVALIVVGTTASGLTVIPSVGVYFAGIVQQIAVFVAPAALIVALKAVYNLARSA